jgi:hypothetical protein
MLFLALAWAVPDRKSMASAQVRESGGCWLEWRGLPARWVQHSKIYIIYFYVSHVQQSCRGEVDRLVR